MLPAIWKAEEENHRKSVGWMWPNVWICFAWLSIVGCCDHSNGILCPIKGGICLDSFTKVNLFLGRRIIYFSVVTVTVWMAKGSGPGFPQGQEIALFSPYRPFLGPILLPREWLPGSQSAQVWSLLTCNLVPTLWMHGGTRSFPHALWRGAYCSAGTGTY